MKRAILSTALVLSMFFITSCSQDDSNINSAQSNMSYDSIEETIQNLANLSLSESFYTNIPSDSVALFNFQRGFEERLPSNKQYEAFKNVFAYLFPNAVFDEEAVYFVGDRYATMRNEWDDGYSEWLNWQNEQIQKGEWDEKTPDYTESNPVPDPPDYNSYSDEILSGKESVQYFYYDYYLSSLKNSRDSLFLEVSSPVGSDLFRFNRGKFIQRSITGELPFMETLTPDQFSELVGTYPASSNMTFPLEDGDCAICDAVDFFENYINDIPLQQDPTFDIGVMKVNVLKDNQNNYLFWFVCSPKYQGVPFDYRDISAHSQQGITQGETGVTSLMSGCMTESNSVEYLDGLLRVASIYSVQPVTNCISAPDAVSIISKSLSGNVAFQAESMELVYTSQQGNQPDNISEIRLDTKPAWKLTLYNTNDHEHYVCFVNAEDGKEFRYYTYGEMT